MEAIKHKCENCTNFHAEKGRKVIGYCRTNGGKTPVFAPSDLDGYYCVNFAANGGAR